MNIPLFAIGLYVIVAGVQGNGDALYQEMKTQYAFIPWFVAVAVLYLFWNYSPVPARQDVRLLIALALGGYAIVNYQTFENLANKYTAFLKGASSNG